ncbi:MAG: hypothetical protein GEV13_00875 [Rhodospirillales bacterium]|nr:hypothetical protein [Rhodospirillales bacterium]
MKRTTINGILNAHIRDHLSPTPKERAMVSREYEFLCGAVGGVCFQSGSYARFTSTTPVNDLDVIWQMPPAALSGEVLRKVMQGYDPGEFDPSEILQRLAATIRAAYQQAGRKVTVVVQSHSIGIYFGTKDDFSIDLVPALAAGRTNEFGDDIYWVPEIARFSKTRRLRHYELGAHIGWMLSDPRGYIEDARQLNEQNESFRKVAKFGRKWRRGCKKENPEFRLKSFHLELVDNDLLKRSPHFDTLDAIEAFFGTLEDYLEAPHFPDRADHTRYVDKYIDELTAEERADITTRIKAARSAVAAMIAAETEEDARQAIRKLLAGSAVAVVVAATVAAPAIATTYTAPTSFTPHRNHGSADPR